MTGREVSGKWKTSYGEPSSRAEAKGHSSMNLPFDFGKTTQPAPLELRNYNQMVQAYSRYLLVEGARPM